METIEFGTRPWFEALERETAAALSRLGETHPARAAGLSYSMSEIATEPPPHIAPGAHEIGWHCVVQAGRLTTFAAQPSRTADYVVVADYDTLRSLSRFRTDGDGARWREYAVLTNTLYRKGRIAVIGAPVDLPRSFATIHDRMAALTA